MYYSKSVNYFTHGLKFALKFVNFRHKLGVVKENDRINVIQILFLHLLFIHCVLLFILNLLF